MWVSTGWLGPIRRLGLLSERSVLNNFVEPLLLSVTTLRDKVRRCRPRSRRISCLIRKADV